MSNTRWWVIGGIGIGLALAACGDNIMTNDRAVLVLTEPAMMQECVDGGVIVSAGIDEDRSGSLDDFEIVTHTVVCNDSQIQPPPPILVRLVAIPAGVHCAVGGTAVQSGPDRNGNGELEEDEVRRTDYVCGQTP